jgi:hypothetical protein
VPFIRDDAASFERFAVELKVFITVMWRAVSFVFLLCCAQSQSTDCLTHIRKSGRICGRAWRAMLGTVQAKQVPLTSVPLIVRDVKSGQFSRKFDKKVRDARAVIPRNSHNVQDVPVALTDFPK